MIGTVKDIVYDSRFQLQSVMVHFDYYQRTFPTEKLFFTQSISKSSKEENVPYSRTQLLLSFAYAFSIYKSEDLTLSKNALDIDPKKFSFAEKYITFSIVCCLKKVLFEASFTKVVALTKFIKVFAFSDRLVFGKYLRQMMTE